MVRVAAILLRDIVAVSQDIAAVPRDKMEKLLVKTLNAWVNRAMLLDTAVFALDITVLS